MRGEVIAIGDELTSGQRLDTNSQWIAERLSSIGVDVLYHTTVGDDLQANILVFANAIERADVVVVTGGLGPTADDLTREALAAAAGAPLQQDDASLAHIRSLFESRGRQMPDSNARQAQLPVGSRAIANQHGTAPGIDLSVQRSGRSPCRVFALPGVPAEMREMWETAVSPAVTAVQGRPRVIAHRRIKCFGRGESDVEAMLPDLIRRGREPRVGITVSKATITLRISTSGESVTACRGTMAPTEDAIRQALGNLVFGEEDEELEHVVLRLLRERRRTVTVLDAASRGTLVAWLAAADAGSESFLGGVVCPLESRMPDDVAEAADQLRRQRGADFCLALSPAEDGEGPASVVVALASGDGRRTKTFVNAGHPDIQVERSAKLALNFLRLRLLNQDAE